MILTNLGLAGPTPNIGPLLLLLVVVLLLVLVQRVPGSAPEAVSVTRLSCFVARLGPYSLCYSIGSRSMIKTAPELEKLSVANDCTVKRIKCVCK